MRDVTGGRGADRTLITAATKSHAVVNLAMDVTRAKGTVVIVGDVGLKVERAIFYRKEIDLLMSTSYGPGRYDTAYEVEGHDYPIAYVRWTENRNMEEFLRLIAEKRVSVDALVTHEFALDEAAQAYRQVITAPNDTLGVLLRYERSIDEVRRSIPKERTLHLPGVKVKATVCCWPRVSNT